MLLPQSSAFATLKNRLNAVSAIGYLSTPAARIGAPPPLPSGQSYSSSDVVPRPNRLKSRDDGVAGIRWNELFEKFRLLQEKQRKKSSTLVMGEWARDDSRDAGKPILQPMTAIPMQSSSRPGSGLAGFIGGRSASLVPPPAVPPKEKTSRNPLGFGKFGGGKKKK
jgi:vacuole morphology and inheritance protein 14